MCSPSVTAGFSEFLGEVKGLIYRAGEEYQRGCLL